MVRLSEFSWSLRKILLQKCVPQNNFCNLAKASKNSSRLNGDYARNATAFHNSRNLKTLSCIEIYRETISSDTKGVICGFKGKFRMCCLKKGFLLRQTALSKLLIEARRARKWSIKKTFGKRPSEKIRPQNGSQGKCCCKEDTLRHLLVDSITSNVSHKQL